MSTKRKLRAVSYIPESASVFEMQVSPVMAGTGPEDCLCGSCGRLCLKGMFPGKVRNIYVKCVCGAANFVDPPPDVINQPPPENIRNMDWRIHQLTWTTEPFKNSAGEEVQAGAAIRTAAIIRYGKEKLAATIPNATALFLNLSYTLREEASSLIHKCVLHKDDHATIPDNDAFTFFERMMGSAVFACTASEAFANEQIPDTFIYEDSSSKKREKKGTGQ
jgi:hypothetical protein